MSKHTPGPWARSYYGQMDGGEKLYAVVTDEEMGSPICECATEADARLIAAAPELLHELAHLVRLLDGAIDDGRVSVPGLATLNGAKAAIAKATGEQ